MHKIDDSSATIDGLFTEGDPAIGLPGTIVTADWLNSVQTEIVNVVEAAGLTLWKPDNAQLIEAIQSLIYASSAKTGDIRLTMRSAADPGWLVCNDGTIGNAGSAATTRANDDTQALFTLLWTNVSNTYAAVSGGRGASAAADFAANKTIALTKMLGRALAVGGSGVSLTTRAPGETTGTETHVLTTAQMPSHAHGVTDPTHVHSVYDPTHRHADTSWKLTAIDSTGGSSPVGADANGSPAEVIYDDYAATGISLYAAATGISIQANGSGSAHPIMQPTTFLYAHIKM